eukprot:UN20307
MCLHTERQPDCHRNQFRLMNQSAKLGSRVDLLKLFLYYCIMFILLILF